MGMAILNEKPPVDGLVYDHRLGWIPEDDIWHPILFKGRLVREILAGNKTQTRRIMRKQPVMRHEGKSIIDVESVGYDSKFEDATGRQFKSPYGAVGHKLWVRENFCVPALSGAPYGHAAYNMDYLYAADDGREFHFGMRNWFQHNNEFNWKPSIHMPRDASRISLLVRRVGCERLQDIDNDDALAEGVSCDGEKYRSPVDAFAELWDSVNKGRTDGDDNGVGWIDNPWVWVVEFEVING